MISDLQRSDPHSLPIPPNQRLCQLVSLLQLISGLSRALSSFTSGRPVRSTRNSSHDNTYHGRNGSLCIGAEILKTHVDGWPGQESTIWSQKVPSVVLYDNRGQVCIVWSHCHSRLEPPAYYVTSCCRVARKPYLNVKRWMKIKDGTTWNISKCIYILGES